MLKDKNELIFPCNEILLNFFTSNNMFIMFISKENIFFQEFEKNMLFKMMIYFVIKDSCNNTIVINKDY
jgi:hypothetical protein